MKPNLPTFAWFILAFSLTVACNSFHSAKNQSTPKSKNSPENIKRMLDTGFRIRLTNPELSLAYANKALKLSSTLNFKEGIAESYRVRGVANRQLNNLYESTEDLSAALILFREIKDTLSQARTYVNMSNIYRQVDQRKALEYLKISLSLIKNRDDNKELLGGIYSSMATLYSVQTDYKRSLIYLDRSLKIFQDMNDERSIISNSQNSGMIYFYLKNYAEAERRTLYALERSEAMGLNGMTLGARLLLSTIYLEQGKKKEAEKIIQQGKEMAVRQNNQRMEMLFLHREYWLNLSQQDLPAALSKLQKLYRYDSTRLERNLSTNIGITARNYFQQQTIQRKDLTIANQKYEQIRSAWILAVVIGIFLLLAVIALIYSRYRQRRWAEEKAKIQNDLAQLEQRSILAMMNPHFIFNVMTSIQQYMHETNSTKASFLLGRFAKLIRSQLEICMQNEISLDEEIEYLDLYLSLEKSRFGAKMNYELTVADGIAMEEINIPSMLIQPFVENAVQHGIMAKEGPGTIKVAFVLEHGSLNVSVSDDGPGLSARTRSRETGHVSRGMGLIKERVELLNKLNERKILINQSQEPGMGTVINLILPV